MLQCPCKLLTDNTTYYILSLWRFLSNIGGNIIFRSCDFGIGIVLVFYGFPNAVMSFLFYFKCGCMHHKYAEAVCCSIALYLLDAIFWVNKRVIYQKNYLSFYVFLNSRGVVLAYRTNHVQVFSCSHDIAISSNLGILVIFPYDREVPTMSKRYYRTTV